GSDVRPWFGRRGVPSGEPDRICDGGCRFPGQVRMCAPGSGGAGCRRRLPDRVDGAGPVSRAESLLEEFGDREGQVDRLTPVEAGVAHGLVAGREVILEDGLSATEAFGDVVAGELDVHPAGPGALGLVGGEESGDLTEDVVEGPGLVTVGGGEGVAVHR